MLSMPSLWWIIGIAGAALLTFTGSRRLAWQFLLVVPLASELVLVLYPAPDPNLSFSISMLSQPEFWAGVPVMYIYGLFMFGGWAVLLGELGWLIVSNVSAIQRMSI